MMSLLTALIAMAAVLVVLRRVIASDGYGARPGPRSHRDIADVDNRGMPTKYAQLR